MWSLLLLAAAVAAPPPDGRPPGPASLTLDQAVAQALERNTDQRGRELQVLSSEQDQVLARAAVLPRLDFNASLGAARVGAGDVVSGGVPIAQANRYFGTSGASVGVRQLLFNGGRWQSDLDVAELSVRSGRESVGEQRLVTAYAVELRFFEVVRATRQLAVLDETWARSRDQAAFAERLFEAARATQADIHAARANRDNDEIQRIGAEARLAVARQELGLVVGAEGTAPGVVEPPDLMAPPAAPPTADEALEQALADRPSLKALQLAVDAQHRHVQGAAADNWPLVAVTGSYGRSTTGLDTFLETPDRNSQLAAGVGLSWNLFSGYATRAQVEKAQVAVLLAENDLVGARRTVAADVHKAVLQLAAAVAQAKVAALVEENAREALRLARVRQELGSGTQLEVRDAELRLTQGQLARVGAAVDGREAEAALRRATGGARMSGSAR